MQVYLVGGAVRDELLKLPVNEWDWVVVGSSPEQMLEKGYQSVGKDFPVFLHPKTKDEYALARTERKTAGGYKGFSFDANSQVTLEEDLKRRDFTVNAMAQDADGNIIDPYGGRTDLANGVLRHVSAAFIEDPVRVLRAARFMARFAHLGFSVASETVELMRKIGVSGELDHLVPERVWQEFQKSLTERHPANFFATLDECGALKKVFPEISQVFNQENMLSLQKAVDLSTDAKVRFAALMQFLPTDLVTRRCQHFHVPKDYSQLAIICAQYRPTYQQLNQATAEEILALLNGLDVWRKPERLSDAVNAWSANVSNKHTDSLNQRLFDAYQAASEINITELTEQGLQGGELGNAIAECRRTAIAEIY